MNMNDFDAAGVDPLTVQASTIPPATAATDPIPIPIFWTTEMPPPDGPMEFGQDTGAPFAMAETTATLAPASSATNNATGIPLAIPDATPPSATDKAAMDQAMDAVRDHLTLSGLPPLNNAGMFERMGNDMASGGYRYIDDQEQWVKWQQMSGCYEDITESAITGFVAQWVLSSALENERKLVGDTIPMKDSPAIKKALQVAYDNAREKAGNTQGWRNAAPKEMSGHPAIRVSSGDFDKYPEIINCINGFIDLRTKTFTPHSVKHGKLFRMSVICDDDPNAECPCWRQYLREAHPGDGDLPIYDQIIGYRSTG